MIETARARIDAALEGVSEEPPLPEEADDLAGLARKCLESVTPREAGVAIRSQGVGRT